MFRGVYPIVATPFHSNGEVDVDGFKRVVRYCLAAGADGLAFPANASEFFTLTVEERKQLAEVLVETVEGRVPVIIGATSSNNDDAVAFARHAQSIGADGLLLLVPNALSGKTEEVFTYLEAVAEAAKLPIMLQNAPAPLGADLPLETVMELMRRVPQIQYVKEERNPSGQLVTALREAAGETPLGIFGGDGGRSIINELARGVDGTMPAVEFVELQVQLFRLYNAGDRDAAVALFKEMLPILNIQRIFRWAATKRIMMWRGIIECDYVRAPGAPKLDETDSQELRMWYEAIQHKLLEQAS